MNDRLSCKGFNELTAEETMAVNGGAIWGTMWNVFDSIFTVNRNSGGLGGAITNAADSFSTTVDSVWNTANNVKEFTNSVTAAWSALLSIFRK